MSVTTVTRSGPMMRQRSNQQRHYFLKSDEADVAATGAGVTSPNVPISIPVENEPLLKNNDGYNGVIYANIGPEEEIRKKVQVFGYDISHLDRKWQFITCASGVFGFSLLYGYLQELLSVTLCGRQLGLFLGMIQFMGYAILSRFFNSYVKGKNAKEQEFNISKGKQPVDMTPVPMHFYILLSILRAIDSSMTNMAMQYINYPAKTLMKSSRVVFTMIFGTIVTRKRYQLLDYIIVLLMVSGLAIFMHADSQSSAVFQPIGIMMLTTSLCCDAIINNFSEKIMNQYHVGQDEFIYKLYSIALVGIVGAAAFHGDLVEGTQFLLTPGTYNEIKEGIEPTWSVHGKIAVFVLFSSTGFLGSSCSALITKEFGALTMSITSTARKATTLFLSFALFNNVCTMEHLSGIALFVSALITKSFRASKKGHGGSSSSKNDKQEKITSAPNSNHYLELEKSPGPIQPSSSYYGNDGMKRRSNAQRHTGDIV
ncbi:solute carrier family 35 (adenosine 3'-phospho 5'-phosphosulfate transporter), member B3 [Chaetoceros tenuissimus]|uniref:Solute carrier family 35 (Adenosine 3'-phospho 5'-phosphosulfate transporter), member B3 n=1 Tax=Chaetoceros tenuissimus TaxID=426638 RepID=A0AAD3CR21_9STRA|nr:solute carrier family 35 (adenosine 3'-phospho 5'-phosphosulfate transporter), member B3 [Chaetoceros tenuissimus]